MGYMNPIEALGTEHFVQLAAASGVDGVLTVDLPPDASEQLIPAMQCNGVDPIFLLSPTTPESRMQPMADLASGFLYYVSLKGVTGANTLDIDEVQRRLGVVRKLTDLPLGVGFGISDADSAAKVAAVADAVVVGSAVVDRIAEYGHQPEKMLEVIREFITELRTAVDSVSP